MPLPAGLPVLSPQDVERFVLANAGARPWDRDGHDVRILANAAEGRGEIIDSQAEVGGIPSWRQATGPLTLGSGTSKRCCRRCRKRSIRVRKGGGPEARGGVSQEGRNLPNRDVRARQDFGSFPVFIEGRV